MATMSNEGRGPWPHSCHEHPPSQALLLNEFSCQVALPCLKGSWNLWIIFEKYFYNGKIFLKQHGA